MGNPIPVTLEQECRKATKILNDFVDPINGLDKIVPLSVLQRAKGFAIFSVFRIGFLLSARAGSGVVIAKLDDDHWSAPAAIGIGGLGGGFNAGAEVTDFLIVLNSKSAVKSFMATGSLQLGGNMSLALGPMGRSAEASGSVNTKGRVAAMFSYSKSKGFYGGISLEGSVLVEREDANAKAYGRMGKNAKQILSGSVDRPDWSDELIQTIDRFTLANTPSKDLDGEYFNYDDTSSFDNRGLGKSGGRRSSIDSLDSRNLDDLRSGRRMEHGSSNGSKSSRKSPRDDLPDRFDDLGLNDRNKPVDQWDQDDLRRKDDDHRNFASGFYAFGTASTLSNTPGCVGSASSQRKRPGLRERSSSIASNLSFSSFGRKKLDRTGPTPPPDWNEIPGHSSNSPAWGRDTDGMDALDRELQGGAPASPTARKSPFSPNKSYNAVAGRNSPYNDVRTGSGLSKSTTPVGWSPFSAADDANDDLFGDSHAIAHDPFAEPGGSYGSYANSSSSNGRSKSPWEPDVRGSAPPPSKSGPSRFGKFRTPSPGSSAFGRKKTPTITEDEGDHLISLTIDDHRTGPNGGSVNGGSLNSGAGRRESFSLSTANANIPVIERVVALYDFEAQEEGDLSFNKGQVIAVIKKTNTRDDWWQGRVEAGLSASKVGLFPASWTAPI